MLSAGITTIQLAPEAHDYLTTQIAKLADSYPTELEIKVENGLLSMNRAEPYIVKQPDSNNAKSENLVVVSPGATIDEYDSYNTFFLINEKNIIYKENGKIYSNPLSDYPDGVITKAKVANFIKTGQNFAVLAPIGIFLGLFIIEVIYYLLFRTTYLLIVALMLSLVGKFRKIGFGFAQYYQIGLHTITLPLLVDLVTTAVGVPIGLPLWFFVFNFLLGVIVVGSLDAQNPKVIKKI